MPFPARCATFLLVAAVLPHTANAQIFVPIFDGSTLNGWQAEHRTADIKDGILTLKNGAGWVRSQRVYANFVLRLDVRLEEQAVADIYVRSWPTFDLSRRPANGASVRLRRQKAVAGSDGWQRLEIEAVGSSFTVRADGEVAYSNPNVGNPQGHIALAVSDKSAQFRNIAIQVRSPQPPAPLTTAARVIGKGVSAPRVIEQPKPRYTADAMRARITGQVTMHCVVDPEGNVTDVQLLQSLDPHFGLDREAMATASKWRFEPGRLEDGQPVAVRIIIQLEFNLK